MDSPTCYPIDSFAGERILRLTSDSDIPIVVEAPLAWKRSMNVCLNRMKRIEAVRARNDALGIHED